MRTADSILLRYQDTETPLLLLPNEEHAIGRGLLYGIEDAGLSRKQITLTLNEDDASYYVTRLGKIASTLNGQELVRNERTLLKNGDVIHLRPGDERLRFDVILRPVVEEQPNDESNRMDQQKETEALLELDQHASDDESQELAVEEQVQEELEFTFPSEKEDNEVWSEESEDVAGVPVEEDHEVEDEDWNRAQRLLRAFHKLPPVEEQEVQDELKRQGKQPKKSRSVRTKRPTSPKAAKGRRKGKRTKVDSSSEES